VLRAPGIKHVFTFWCRAAIPFFLGSLTISPAATSPLVHRKAALRKPHILRMSAYGVGRNDASRSKPLGRGGLAPPTPSITPRRGGGQILISKAGGQAAVFQTPASPQPAAAKPTVAPRAPPSAPVQIVTAPRAPPAPAPAAAPRPSQITRLPPAQSDLAFRLSLASFVARFEDGRSFNETELAGLGLDLRYDRPILPLLHSVLSEAPLAARSWHAVPAAYRAVAPPGPPQDKLALFSEQTLLFIVETEPRTALQALAADELAKRGFAFDDDAERWRTPGRREWDTEHWREADAPADPTEL
jgi:hypothetical protein